MATEAAEVDALGKSAGTVTDEPESIAPISRLCLAYISPMSRLYLAYISPISRLYLTYISQGDRRARVDRQRPGGPRGHAGARLDLTLTLTLTLTLILTLTLTHPNLNAKPLPKT